MLSVAYPALPCASVARFAHAHAHAHASSLKPRVLRIEPAGRRHNCHPRPLDPTMPTVHASGPPSPESEPEPYGAHRSNWCGGHRPPGRAPSHPRSSSPLSPTGSHAAFSSPLDFAARKHSRSRLPRPSAVAALTSLTLGLSSLLSAAAAAAVPFENCLPESYVNNVPTPLQWVPQRVEASFNATDPKHTLRVTMWGNVKGTFTNVTLPPPDSPDWKDPTKTDGKILDEPEPDVPNPKLTTLHSKIEVLTYEPWSENTNFCNTSLVNASCPLAPVFVEANSRYACPIPLPSRRPLVACWIDC